MKRRRAAAPSISRAVSMGVCIDAIRHDGGRVYVNGRRGDSAVVDLRGEEPVVDEYGSTAA